MRPEENPYIPIGPVFNAAKAGRAHSRRETGRAYGVERLSAEGSLQRDREVAPEFVNALTDAGRTGAALRRRLKAWRIDPKLARLVLLFYRRDEMCVSDVAWSLGISVSTASRWLDRAEREGLVDKVYGIRDRRTTRARLTTRGVVLRGRVERLLETMPTNVRPRGFACGNRNTPGWDE